MTTYQAACDVHNVYIPGTEFPRWVLHPDIWNTHSFNETKAYFHEDDQINDVFTLVDRREPCNIAMRRLYDQKKMKSLFGYEKGAYTASMPNIGVYCHATVLLNEQFVKAHVLNLIGLAFDVPNQPDYEYYSGKSIDTMVEYYRRMWELAVCAAKSAHPDITKIKLYNVGGGAFAGPYRDIFNEKIFEPAFSPFLSVCTELGIEVDGYDWETHCFNGGRIPDVLVQDNLKNTLYINAWDPWSLIGNGNEFDNSLDGHWGRISNMAVLGWYRTNPHMKFVRVQ